MKDPSAIPTDLDKWTNMHNAPKGAPYISRTALLPLLAIACAMMMSVMAAVHSSQESRRIHPEFTRPGSPGGFAPNWRGSGAGTLVLGSAAAAVAKARADISGSAALPMQLTALATANAARGQGP